MDHRELRRIEALRDKLKEQIAGLQNQLAGVEMTLSAIRDISQTQEGPRRSRGVKQLLLDLLIESGQTGTNALRAVEWAKIRNERLERATVSSLLSRFKRDGVVTFDGSVYRLKNLPSTDGAMH
jgi:hypothetical protein